MAGRRERTVGELCNATESIGKPEITPVLRGIYRMQGPVDEKDHDNMYMVSSESETKFGNWSMSKKVHMRGESGTCNVCSAPCSSCMHLNRSLMGSKTEEFSDESCRVNVASQYSVNESGTLYSLKNRASDSLQHTTSETSNLLSVNSSHDSFSENADSKATLRSSVVSDALEDVEMLPNLTSGGTIAEDQLSSKPQFVLDQRVSSNMYEETKAVEGHDDNISSVSRANDANEAVRNHNRNINNSTASISSLGPEGSGKATYLNKSGSLEIPPSKDLDAGSSPPKVRRGRPVGGISEVSMKKYPKSEAETDKDSGDPPDEAMKSSDQDEHDDKSNELVELTDMQEPPLQSVSGDESDESDIVEQDVKVCDICGDAGREDLLAICSRCSDGAEHTYCMREMLQKVPEGDWLCEECKFAEESENQKQGSEVEEKKLDKLGSCTIVSGKRCAENIEVAPAKRQALETGIGSPKPSSPSRIVTGSTKPSSPSRMVTGSTKPSSPSRIVTGSPKPSSPSRIVTGSPKPLSPSRIVSVSPKPLSPSKIVSLPRDSSFKSIEKGKVKSAHQTSFGNHSGTDIPETARFPATGPRPQKVKGPLVKSNSFNTLSSKPKVKLGDEVIPPKQKGARDYNSLDMKEGPARMMGKSMSFRSATSGRTNATESKVKMLSSKSTHVQDVKGLKQAKERGTFERKHLSKLDRPLVSSTTSSTVSTPKLDQKLTSRGETSLPSYISNNRDSKVVQSDGKLSLSKVTSSLGRKGVEIPVTSGGASSTSGICSSAAEQKLNLVSPKDEPLSTYPLNTERSSNSADVSGQDGLPRSQETANQYEKTRESSTIRSRPTAISASKSVFCQKCKDSGHATEFCTIGTPQASGIDVSAVRSSREESHEGNKLKAAIQAAWLRRPEINRKKKVFDQPDELSTSSTDMNNELASQDQFLVSNKPKNIMSTEGSHERQAVLGSSTSDSCKDSGHATEFCTIGTPQASGIDVSAVRSSREESHEGNKLKAAIQAAWLRRPEINRKKKVFDQPDELSTSSTDMNNELASQDQFLVSNKPKNIMSTEGSHERQAVLGSSTSDSCKDSGHATEFCTIGTPQASGIDVSAVRSSREESHEGNKLKAAIQAALLRRPEINRKKKVFDQPDELSTSSTDMNNELASQDQFLVSNKPKNIMSTEGSHERQAVLGSSTSDSCKDSGHATEFCTIGTPQASGIDVSSVRSSREESHEGNKLKAAIQAALLRRPEINRKKKVFDQPDELSTSSTDMNNELASQDQFLVSNKPKNIMSTEGSHERQAVLGSSTSDSCKHAVVNNSKQSTLPPTGVFSSKVEDSDSAIISIGKHARELPSHTSTAMSSLLKPSAIPEYEYIWQGGFEVHKGGKLLDLCGGIQAHLSTCASPKVFEVVNKFPHKVPLHEVPRMSTWPSQFIENGAKEDNIALYFFAKDVESYERNYKSLLDSMIKHDLALKGNLDGVELLIFPSNQLPEKSQRWNMLFFLWGVFRGKRVSCIDSSKKLNIPSLNVLPPDKDIPSAVMTLSENLCAPKRIDEESAACIRSGNVVLTSNVPDQTRVTVCRDSDNNITSFEHTCLGYQESLEQQGGRRDYKSISKIGTSGAQLSQEMRHSSLSLKELSLQERLDAELKMPLQVTGKSGSNNGGKTQMHWDTSSDRDDRSSLKILPVDNREIGILGSVFEDKIQDRMNGVRDQVKLQRDFNEGDGFMDREMALEKDVTNHRKRPYLDLSEKAPQTSIGTSQKIPWNEVSNIFIDGESTGKRLKTGFSITCGHSGGSRGSNSRNDNFASQVVDPGSCSSVEEKTCDEACDEKVIPEDTGNSERYFFPLGSHRAKDFGIGDNTMPWKKLALDEDNKIHDVFPNLELALGAETKPANKGMLPFLGGTVGKKNNQEKAPDKVIEVEDDGDSTSLSLSLSFPFPDKEQTVKPVSKTEQLLSDRPNLNTPLLLFGSGFGDK